MSTIIADHFTAQIEGPFVVFLVGMQVNKPFHFRKWIKVSKAFVGMQQVLADHPEKGCFGGELFFRFPPLTTCWVSYWRSFEALETFARSKDDAHLEAWIRFNREIGTDGTIGVWHETYPIGEGQYEASYVNMPLFGLAGATKQAIPIRGGYRQTARGRLTGKAETANIPEPVTVVNVVQNADELLNVSDR
ncbi:MAG: DUF4188 domain-containing protein [Chloroflexota bacterium]